MGSESTKDTADTADTADTVVQNAPDESWRRILCVNITFATKGLSAELSRYQKDLTLGDLANMTSWDFKKIPGLGKSSMNEVIFVIRRASRGEDVTRSRETLFDLAMKYEPQRPLPPCW